MPSGDVLTQLLRPADYRETAAKFQKEWRVQQPHRQFDFAPLVKNYALVDVLNKGLVYQGLERDYMQSLVSLESLCLSLYRSGLCPLRISATSLCSHFPLAPRPVSFCPTAGPVSPVPLLSGMGAVALRSHLCFWPSRNRVATLTIYRPQVPGDAAAAAAAGEVPQGVFGPLVPQPPINYDQLQDEDEEPPPPPSAPAGEDAAKSQQPRPQPSKSQSLSQPQPQSLAQSQPHSQSLSNALTHQQSQSSLKRQVDAQSQLANVTPAKRPRLGNAVNGTLENGADAATSPMDVDNQQSDNHAYPSPLEGEQASTPAPRTEGPDHATQIEKVEELGPKTIYLRLAPDESLSLSSASAAATPITAEASHLRAHQQNHNPILLQCEWNPKDPTRLAAAGTDALARVWTVSRATGPDQAQGPDHVADREDPNCPNINLVNNDDIPPNSKVTAFSWAFDGKRIAVATEDDQTARIGLCNLQGAVEHHWEGFETPVVKLRCNPVNRTILSISPSTAKNASNQPDGWVVSVMSSLTGMGPIEYRLSGHDVFLDEPDVAWMNGTDFLVCVGTKLMQLSCAGDSINLVKQFATRPDDPLTAIQYDGASESGYIAAATSSGHIDVSESLATVASSSSLLTTHLDMGCFRRETT